MPPKTHRHPPAQLVLCIFSWAKGQRTAGGLDPIDPSTASGAPYADPVSLKPENIAGIRFGGCTASPDAGDGLSLNTSWCCIPHPAKAHRGGEDAVFATPHVVGVADGVGGWAARGVDSGLYARGLMDGCKRALTEVPELIRNLSHSAVAGSGSAVKAALKELLNPVLVLKTGYDSVQAQHIIGSTTACVVSCIPWPTSGSGGGGGGMSADASKRATLQVANLGDSGMPPLPARHALHNSGVSDRGRGRYDAAPRQGWEGDCPHARADTRCARLDTLCHTL